MNYTIIDNSIMDSTELSLQEQSVYIALVSFYNKKKGYAYPSYSKLKARSKITDTRTLQKHVLSLVNKGYVMKETLRGIGCKYYLPSLNSENIEEVDNDKNNIDVTIEKVTKENNKNVSELWKLYPKKKGKKVAMDKLPKLIKKYGYEQMERCINRYAKEVNGKEEQFILYGSTFFSKGRFEDYLDSNYQTEKAMDLGGKQRTLDEIMDDLYK